MRKTNLHNWCAAVAVLAVSLALAIPLAAQDDGYITNSNMRGKMSFGSFQNGNIDNINLATGTVNLKIPLTYRRGRGIEGGLDYVYSSKMWVLRPSYDPNTGNLTNFYWLPSNELLPYGVIMGTGEGGSLGWNWNQYTCYYTVGRVQESYVETILSNFVLQGPDGAKYQFPNSVVVKNPNVTHSCNQPLPGSGEGPPPPPNVINISTGYSDTGTMMLNTSNTSTFVVTFKDGVQLLTMPQDNFQWATSEVIDRNGNFIGTSGTDTVGRTSLTDSAGNAVVFATHGNSVPGSTAFPTTGNSGCIHQDANAIFGLTTQLNLPNGQSYTLTYDPNFGELTQVTLPAGGYIKYVYQAIPALDQNPFVIDVSGMNTCYTGLLDSRRVTERHVSSDGVTESVWHYSYSVSFSSQTDLYTYQTTVTDPLGNVTVSDLPPFSAQPIIRHLKLSAAA